MSEARIGRKWWHEYVDMKVGLGSILAGAVTLFCTVGTIAVVLSTVSDLKTTVGILVTSDNNRHVSDAVEVVLMSQVQINIKDLQADERTGSTRMNAFDVRANGWDGSINELKERYSDLLPTGHRK